MWKYSLSEASSADQALQLLQPALGGADRHAVLAARVAAGLTRIEPVLDGAGQQAVGDVPEVRVLVLVGQLVAQVDRLGEGGIEGFRGLRSVKHEIIPSPVSWH